MSAQHDRYSLMIAPTARRQLAEVAAAAAHEFIVGPLLDNPHRIGKRLRRPLEDRHTARRGTYRVIYRIDDGKRSVTVVDLAHRRDTYRRTSVQRPRDAGAAGRALAGRRRRQARLRPTAPVDRSLRKACVPRSTTAPDEAPPRIPSSGTST